MLARSASLKRSLSVSVIAQSLKRSDFWSATRNPIAFLASINASMFTNCSRAKLTILKMMRSSLLTFWKIASLCTSSYWPEALNPVRQTSRLCSSGKRVNYVKNPIRSLRRLSLIINWWQTWSGKSLLTVTSGSIGGRQWITSIWSLKLRSVEVKSRLLPQSQVQAHRC